MAVYKVPQDVEAEDKLIGPFSFRQFIYLIVAALGIFMAWLLAQIFIGLLILPLPIVFAFLALALPLRKDQPMETYLIAMLKFFFKPRKRIWDPEGTISLVRITAPKVIEGPQLKGFGGDEASQRLAYLAQVVDTQGWSTRGATSANDTMSDIFIAEATHAEDILDSSSGVAQAFDQRMSQTDDARMSAVRQQFQAAIQQPVTQLPTEQPAPAAPIAQPTVQATPNPQVTQTDATAPHFNPYPSSMHQHVVSPTGSSPQSPVISNQSVQDNQQSSSPDNRPLTTDDLSTKNASAETVSPDIMRLANNNDLSISALANEAHRLENDDKEVVISLR
jgi:hypothetical protein